MEVDSSGLNKIKKKAKFNEQEIKQLQHEITIYTQQWSKEKVGKGSNIIKVLIFQDMLIYRGEGILSDTEKYISQVNPDIIREARHRVLAEYWPELVEYLEKILKAQIIHHIFDIEAQKDFWMHVIVFDQYLN